MRRLGWHESPLQLRSGRPDLEGIQSWILNYAKEARRLADFETEPQQQRNIGHSQRLDSVAHSKPTTFPEAMQMIWTFTLPF